MSIPTRLPDLDHWKAQGLDLAAILYRPEVGPEVATHCVVGQDHGLEQALDQALLPLAAPALRRLLDDEDWAVVSASAPEICSLRLSACDR